MKQGVYIFIAIIFLTGPVCGQSIDLNINTEATTKASFIGSSTEFLYPIVRGIPNADASAYDSVYVSEEAFNRLSDLNLNYLRFPGGTVSQYYHFSATNGYGSHPFDLDCRTNFIDLPGFREKVRLDEFYPVNMIERYIDLHKKLEQERGAPIQTLYVINLMTHYFGGDLIPTNPIIDALIDSYGANLGAFLDASPSFLSDELMEDVIDVMVQVYNDPLMGQMKAYLLDQESFQIRAAENIAAIAYLISEDIPIAGIELGNENYSFTMLKDDDLSEIPYDCTTPDSIVAQFGPLILPLRTYMQAIIKYGMLTSMYDALIDELFEIPTGVVIHSTRFNLDAAEIDSFVVSVDKTESYRYYEIWNRFLGRMDFYDAVIPHMYMKPHPKCDLLEALSADSLEIYGKAIIDYYMTDVLDYQLNRIQEEVNNKTLWITEWNMNTANIFGNTFLQGSYVFQFMNDLNRRYQDYNIDLLNFHNIAAWRYNQFALLRTDEFDSEFIVNLQSMYEPFMLMGDIHKEMPALGELDMSAWLGDQFLNGPDHYFYPYYSEGDNRLIIHFVNQSGIPLDIPMSGLEFKLALDSNPQPSQQPASYDAYYIDAESFFSSNEGCPDYPEIFDDYEWKSSSGLNNDFQIPGYSFGRLNIELELRTGISDFEVLNFEIHPNPSSTQFQVQFASSAALKSMELIIFDLTGRKVGTAQISNGSLVDVQYLPEGVYFIQLSAPDHSALGVKKLIVRNR